MYLWTRKVRFKTAKNDCFNLVGGLEHLFFKIVFSPPTSHPYIGNHHPNWRTHIFQRKIYRKPWLSPLNMGLSCKPMTCFFRRIWNAGASPSALQVPISSTTSSCAEYPKRRCERKASTWTYVGVTYDGIGGSRKTLSRFKFQKLDMLRRMN